MINLIIYLYIIISCLRRLGEYKTAKHAHTVYIHPSSVLIKSEDPPEWVVYHELAFTTKEYMRMVLKIKSEWLIEIAPHYYNKDDITNSILGTNKKMPKAVGKAVDEVTTTN